MFSKKKRDVHDQTGRPVETWMHIVLPGARTHQISRASRDYPDTSFPTSPASAAVGT